MSTIASPRLNHTPVEVTSVRDRASLARRVLLGCGIVAWLLYVATDVVAAMRWEGYRYTSQSISELMAIGAPSRPLVVPLFITHDVLLIAFGVGVWESGRTRALRVTASLLIGIGALGLVATPFFPMHLRGAAGTLTDAMHITLTSVMVLFILLAIGFGATADGKRFRLYSIGTLVILVVFGTIAGLDGPRIAAQQPTPWLGITERITIYAYLLWLPVLAIVLLRGSRERRPSC